MRPTPPMSQLLLHKTEQILTNANNHNQTTISKLAGTYYWVIQHLRLFEQKGLLTITKQGRLKICTLTQKGQLIVAKILEIKSLLNNTTQESSIIPQNTKT